MNNPSEPVICPFCKSLLQAPFKEPKGICANPKCRSNRYIVGNVVLLRSRPDFGYGIIGQIKSKRNETTGKEEFLVYADFSLYIEKPLRLEEIAHYIFELDVKVRFRSNDKKRVGMIAAQNLAHPSGLIHYEIQIDHGKPEQIAENQIQNIIQNPLEEFLSQRIDPVERFLLRLWGFQMRDQYASNLLKIITHSRLSLLPHQISVAHHLLSQIRARYILADEVGLGKTIEAGIFIKEMIARKLAAKVLIITPASITGQWEFELRNKFNLNFTRISAEILKSLEINPYTATIQNIKSGNECMLCTATLQFARLGRCAEFLTQVEWDIVIFDEAHHLRRYLSNQKTEQYHETLAYRLAQDLGDKTQSLLLLTATPIQLHSFDLYSLVQLLNPFEFPTFDAFESARKSLAVLNVVVRNLRNFTRINTYERKALPDQILAFEPALPLSEIEEKVRFQPWRENLIQRLEQRHFLSRYIIRNRRRIVFPDSKIKRLPFIMEVELTEPEFAIYQKIHLYLARVYSQSFETGATAQGFIMVILQKLLTSSAPAMIKSLKKRITYLEQNQDAILKLGAETEDFREFCDDESTLDAFGGLEELDLEDRLVVQARKRQMLGEKKVSKMNLRDHIQILKEFVADLQDLKKDSKVEQLLSLIHQILSNNPAEKILIFTQFKETLYYIARLIEAKGYTASQFHGDLNEMQKNQAVMRFRHEVPIMLSTEIGGEGRNFQFCHIIVNYDLPWNPMRLEQRIGRLDRIGQTQNVQIYNFYIKNTVESSIITAIAERIHLFEESIGALEPILGNLERQITDLVLKDDEIPTKFRLDEVIAKTTNKIEEVYAKLDDIILDKRSFQYDYLSNDLDRPDLLTGIDIFHFIRLFASISEENQPPFVEMKRYNPQHEDAVWHLQIAEDYTKRLGVEKRRFSGVFDMDFARIEEEHDFFALGHPLIMGLTDFASSMEFGGLNTLLYIDGAKWGSYFLSPYTARLPAAELELFQKVLRAQTGLCLFVFELEFLGCLVEKRVVPILITDEAEPLLTLAAFIGRPHNFSQIIVWDPKILAQFKKNTQKPEFTREILEQCYKQALQSTKILIKNRLEELSELNRTRYALEKANIMKLAEHKKKYAETQTKSLSQKLRVKKMKLPTEKQIENVEKLLDPAKKKRRLKEFETIKNEVRYYESEIKRWESTLNDIEFDLPEQLKRLERYKQLLVNANFIGFARIRIV